MFCCVLQYDAARGELSLVGDASEMEYESALNSVIYINTSVLAVTIHINNYIMCC